MLSRILLYGLAVSMVVIAGCRHSTDDMLIGTWILQDVHHSHPIWLYRSDHKLQYKGFDLQGHPVSEMGTWRLDGDHLYQSIEASDTKPAIPEFGWTIL